MMSGGKKRKVDAEGGQFQQKWTEEFFFILHNSYRKFHTSFHIFFFSPLIDFDDIYVRRIDNRRRSTQRRPQGRSAVDNEAMTIHHVRSPRSQCRPRRDAPLVNSISASLTEH
ncbi:hypothetical protein EVAR_95398_1 [Eumeta japonica]|uniref:Uncharacterized protein n=1 Tax=Eumeta variegata TaxID=151549 RepID=A0A4C1VHA7_EUMVA|nr:hypothetical protein EVAR_95398_1 [Eumeta japonica]